MTAGLLLDNGVTRVHLVTFAGLCLDVAGGSVDDGAPVIAWAPKGNLNQTWVIDPCGTPDHPDEVRIIAGHSGRVLDIAGEGAAGTHVIQWTWHGGPGQRWRLVKRANGSTGIVASRLPNLTLDLEYGSGDQGRAVIVWTPHDGANQGFTPEVVS